MRDLTPYKGRDCPGEYKNLASECRTLENTLRDLGDVLKKQNLDPKKEEELLERGQGCREVLTDLEALIDKYNSLSSKSKKTWDRLNWDQQGGRDLRARLTSNVAMLCAFYDSLIHSSQLRIEEALNQLAADIRGGHREASSVISFASAEDSDEDTAWPQIIRDLEDLGITATMADEYRSFILDWFVRAINEGMLQEKAPEGEDDDSLYAPPSASGGSSSITAVDSWSESPFELPALSVRQVTRRPVASSAVSVQHPPNVQTTPRAQTLPQAQLSLVPHQAYSKTPDPTPQQMSTSQTLSDPLTRSSSEPVKSSEDSNIIWTAQRIVFHWNNREWKEAEVYLQQQVKAVEAGESIDMKGIPCQPDLRLLRHLLGICASYQGDFVKAKKFFELVQRGPYVNSKSLDDGDLAAARWLGDTCLLLGEPENAALAWAIALDGDIGTMGTTRQPTSHVHSELQELNAGLRALGTLDSSFSRYNVDASSIFSTTSNTAKAHLVVSSLERIRHGYPPSHTRRRPFMDVAVAEGFLVQPLIAQSSWPIKYDPFFSSAESIALHSIFSPTAKASQLTINYKNLPTIGIGQSKKLDYSTRKDPVWLVETLKRGLKVHGIEYVENIHMLFCRLSHMNERIAFYEAIGIKVRKLALRSVYGVHVTEPTHQTRWSKHQDLSTEPSRRHKVRNEIASLIKNFLADAEREATSQQQQGEEAALMQAHLRAQKGGPAPPIYGHEVHVLNASPPPPVPRFPSVQPATPIIYASPAPPMPPVPPPPVPTSQVQTVEQMQHPKGGYAVGSHMPYDEQADYQQVHGYYGKI